MHLRRVVITGLGIVSPVGNDPASAWSNLTSGISGVRTIDRFDPGKLSTQFAGTIQDFDPTQWVNDVKDLKKIDTFITYGIAAATQAVADAGIAGYTPPRIGVAIGSGIGGIGTIDVSSQTFHTKGPRRVSPFMVPSSIVNMASGHVSMMHNFQGPNIAAATACTTGTHMIGLAARMIAHGDADAMVCGGAEAPVYPLCVAGFASARALSTRNDDPLRASRPWDKQRDGFVMGEGAGVMVLETLESALERGATIHAELCGFGMSSDAYHITLPEENGTGAYLAMQNALNDADLDASSIDYINAHGTSTLAGDRIESKAIERLFGEHANKLAVSSSKSMTGHLLGAAGAIEAIFSVQSIMHQCAPPTINLDDPDEGCNLDYVPHTARPMPIRYALSNSFGFGGTNGSLVFGPAPD